MVADTLEREQTPPSGLIASPVPQYQREAENGYERVKGRHNAPFAILKNADGDEVDEENPLPVEDAEALAELQAILAKLSADPATQATVAAILAQLDVALSTRAAEATQSDVKTAVEALAALIESGRLKTETHVSGSKVDLRGLAANRPNADAVDPGVIYTAADTGQIHMSDGSDWNFVGVLW